MPELVSDVSGIDVGFLLPALHVGWQGQLPVGGLVDRAVPGDPTVAELVDCGDGAGAGAHFHLTPDLHALARTHEAAPVEEGGIVHPQELYSLVVGEEPGRDYPRVVEDQEVVLPEEGGEPGEEAVLDRAPLPVNDHHA